MYLIGVDIGTTGTKTTIINQDGGIISTSYMVYDLIKGKHGFVEQDANDWWNTLVFTVRESASKIRDKEKIAAVSVSTQGGSLVCVDKNGTPLSNAMVWMDLRSKKEQADLINQKDADYYYKITGWRLSAGLNLCKINWIKKNLPEVFNKTYKFLSTIDFVNYKLTGSFAIDPSNAAMTQLYDIKKGDWSNELLSLAGITHEKLPVIKKSASILGELTGKAAAALGLSQKVLVVSGAHDQYSASVGCGVTIPGQLLVSTGTAFAMLGVNNKPVFNTNTYLSPGPHVIDNLWGELATVPTAGLCMEWFKNNIASESFEKIDKNAQNSDCDDLYFYPYFSGSAFPDNNMNAKGCLMGLSMAHTKYHIARSVMEGVAFQLRYALERFEKSSRITITGGACKSKLWLDILSNILPYELYKITESNTAALGGALIAGVGSGVLYDYTLSQNLETIVPKHTKAAALYNEKYEKYKMGLTHIHNFYGG